MSHSDSELTENVAKTAKDLTSTTLSIARPICRKYKLVNNLSTYQVRQLRQGLRAHCNTLRKYEKNLDLTAKFLLAVTLNDVEKVKAKLQLGLSPNATDSQGRSALHLAVSKGYADVVKVLLEEGADPNRVDRLCNTPLHLAACTNNLTVISMLLKAGADVSRLDLHGKNPLQLAESKLQLLRRWRHGSVEMFQVRSELQLIIDIFISVLTQQRQNAANIEELQMMKLSIKDQTDSQVDDQITKLLTELQACKI